MEGERERDGETGRQTDRQTGIARICRVSSAVCALWSTSGRERERRAMGIVAILNLPLPLSLPLSLSLNVFKYLHFYCEPGTRCACFASLAAQPHCSSRLTEICGGSVARERKRLGHGESEQAS